MFLWAWRLLFLQFFCFLFCSESLEELLFWKYYQNKLLIIWPDWGDYPRHVEARFSFFNWLKFLISLAGSKKGKFSKDNTSRLDQFWRHVQAQCFQMKACIYLLSETTVARVPKITSPGQLLRNSCAVKWLERTKAETDLRQHTWVRTPGGCVLLLPTADP